MIDVISVADSADMIVDGYAFSHMTEEWVRVLNLNNPKKALVFTKEGNKIVETTMDDIEIQIVIDCFNKNKEFMGE